MPEEAPVAVEPRKIKQPTETNPARDLDEADGEIAESVVATEKKSLPLIPILAGLVALVVLGLLGKVVLAK
ncbi:MAG: hypothetical protein ACI8XO_001776 [Verrucomicrobiales bacterium]